MNNRFNDFLKNFGRIQESAPIWQFYNAQDDKVKVFVSKFKTTLLPQSSEYCKLDTMKDWLNFWRQQAPKEKILCSAMPIRTGWRNSRPDSIFTFVEVTNVYEYITEFLGISIPFVYDEAESHFGRNYFKQFLLQHRRLFPGVYIQKSISTHGNSVINVF